MSLRSVKDKPASSRVSGALGASGKPLPSHSSPIWRLANMDVPWLFTRPGEEKNAHAHGHDADLDHAAAIAHDVVPKTC